MVSEEAKEEYSRIMAALVKTGQQMGYEFAMQNIQDVWCTFPDNLLNKLSDEQKKEMFQRIQKVIDEYSTNDA